MSISQGRHDAVATRLSRKRDISGRHKEILSEIFYFTKNLDIPPEVEAAQEQLGPTDDLREFLRINDLESGHVFQETTLSKVQNGAVKAPVEAPPPTTPTVPKTTVAQPPVTPQTNTSSTVTVQPPSSGSGRMVTRVSSGAIRHKSVGELLGQQEAPKHTHIRSTEMTKDQIEALAAGYVIPPPVPNPAKQQPPSAPTRPRGGRIFKDPTLTTPPSTRVDLDRIQATVEVWPLDVITRSAHKSLRTTDHLKNMSEKKNVAIIARINELKEAGLWSLRQPMKQKLPSRGHTHWDYLLKEMEWLSTDFYEERKFKMAGAYLISRAVMEYFQAEDKDELRHKWPRTVRTPVKHFEEEVDVDEDVLMVNHRGSASPLSINHEPEPMREVENPQVNGERQHPSSESRAMQTSVPAEIVVAGGDNTLPTPSPSQCEVDDLPAVFDLPSDVIYASVNELPKVDGSSLAQLPMYGPPVLTDEEYHNIMDAFPIVPISKFCLERHVIPVKSWTPPNRHYRQDTPEEEDDILDISKEVQVEPIPNFAPAGQEAQPSRRRPSAIVIRPPAPPHHLSDQRPSPWTDEEIHLLLQYARENAYNFELVASALSFSSSSISVTEKRTAWECFEKFREVFPDAGAITLVGPNRNLALSVLDRRAKRISAGPGRLKNGAGMLTKAARMDVRNYRYLNMFDIMKKSAKNREKAKAQEKPTPKKPKDNLPTTKAAMNVPTPLELARLKAERDRQIAQSILQQRQEQMQALRMQIPNATPEMAEDLRRQWAAQQQQQQAALLQGQALRQITGLGRGSVMIPGGPNARPMPIRPNAGTPTPANPAAVAAATAVGGLVPVRLPAQSTQEQLQAILKQRNQLAALQVTAGARIPQTPQQIQQLRAMAAAHQAQAAQAQAQAQAAGANPAGANGIPEYIPFIAQTNGAPSQVTASQVANLVANNRLMQPPQNNAMAGIRAPAPQLQLGNTQQSAAVPPGQPSPAQQQQQQLRGTPPRPPNLNSPTTTHFAVPANPTLPLQAMLAYVQQQNPQLTLQEATKVAMEQLSRLGGANHGLLPQHLAAVANMSSPKQANQPIPRRSPSQGATTPHQQGRMS